MTAPRFVKWLFSLFLLVSLIFHNSCSKDEDGDEGPVVTANEGLYINEVYATGEDWIELYNDTDATKDLSGYKIYDDPSNKYILPAGTSVPSKGFLVIICDDLNTGLHASFKLSSSGETIYLESGTDVIDKVIFPVLDNGQSYGRYPDGSSTFAVSGNTTQQSSNGISNAPAIASVTRSPLVVAEQDDVVVTANFVSLNGVSSVKLHYRVEQTGSYTAVDMTLSSGAYVATIPALNAEGRIDYYVEASNSFGTATNPNSAPEKTHFYLMTDDQLPSLVINEYMAANTECCPDKDGGMDEFDDWIEIRNNGSASIDVGGMYLSDNRSNPFGSRIPDSNPTLTTIPPGGYLLFWADNNKDQGDLHLSFGLSIDGEDLGLYYYDGRAIDELTFGVQTENTSMARTPDGTGDFAVTSSPTPNAPN
jgi:hypothetical protein